MDLSRTFQVGDVVELERHSTTLNYFRRIGVSASDKGLVVGMSYDERHPARPQLPHIRFFRLPERIVDYMYACRYRKVN